MKKYRFFIVKFPNGRELLYRAKIAGWYDFTNIVDYFNRDYTENISIRYITTKQMIKYIFRGNKNVN